jgi:hypothetical protein
MHLEKSQPFDTLFGRRLLILKDKIVEFVFIETHPLEEISNRILLIDPRATP